ncbi:MAG: exosome complex RNA-binding protein Csl4 [Candidatus Bathyarchaeota archaeon]|nr:exosome complex RNA-binding protein Csl4 [Candidatus Bathyarchaeota archaeon]
MSEEKKSGRFIVPGEKIGVIEEFIPDKGTYVKDGVIYSSNIGYLLIDSVSRRVSVYPLTRKVCFPRVGSIVVGHVVNIQSAMAFIRIIKVGNRFPSGFFTGVLHISDIGEEFIENIFDALKLGDLVRAKVISEANRMFHLSTKGEKMGVILALCSKCGSALKLKYREKGRKREKNLYCEDCGNTESRKIASDYGLGNL